MKKTKIFAISGSLRSNSSATSVLRQVATLIPGEVEFKFYEGLGSIPHFDGNEDAPMAVQKFRNLVAEADGVFICTPEYAFGVPGTLKNAFDWTASSGEFTYKPVALITAATGGDKAHASLLLTLSALTANVTEDATLLISFIRSKLNEKGEVKDIATLNAIKKVIDSFIQTIENTERESRIRQIIIISSGNFYRFPKIFFCKQ